MATESSSECRNLTYENIVSFVRSHEDPCITATELASEFNISSQAANYRLKQLKKRGKVECKQAGSSAKVWYAVG